MCHTLRIILTSFFLLITVFLSDCYEQKDGNKKIAGNPCQLDYPGTCKNVKNCTTAWDALKIRGQHGLKRCGFEGIYEIVCCPDHPDRPPIVNTTSIGEFIWPSDLDISTRPTTEGDNGDKGQPKIKRKSEKMCEKIYTDNNITAEGPFLLSDLTATVGQFPHAAALGFENEDGQIEWNCGASLISSTFLLTAANCIICIGCSDPKKARLGTIDLMDSDSWGAQDVDVKNVTFHPDYNPASKHNDIAIVELVQDVQMSTFVYPACLYTKVDDPLWLQVIGWPLRVSEDAKSRILEYALVQPVPVSECHATIVSKNRFSPKIILETQICTTTIGDDCVGDSGSALHIMEEKGGYTIVGVVSYGSTCGSKIPDVYTRVAKYLDWIEQIVWPEPTN